MTHASDLKPCVVFVLQLAHASSTNITSGTFAVVQHECLLTLVPVQALDNSAQDCNSAMRFMNCECLSSIFQYFCCLPCRTTLGAARRILPADSPLSVTGQSYTCFKLSALPCPAVPCLALLNVLCRVWCPCSALLTAEGERPATCVVLVQTMM